jgi:predicted glycosyltransferase
LEFLQLCAYQSDSNLFKGGYTLRILFNIGHPAQVHLFKNLIWELERRGHQCKITTIAKDVSLYLLDAYGFKYEVVGEEKPTLATKALELFRVESRLYRIAHSFRPDILVGGVGNVYVAHVGKLLQKPSIVFDDTEHANIDHRLMDPFVSVICTPSCYRNDIGPKQVRYNGYHELAYLHPNRFNPNPAVLDELGLIEGDPFIIVRFVSWQASHDVGQHGIRDKVGLVKALEQYGRVLVTSEGVLPPELQPYQMRVSPEKLHDLLYYATLYMGEVGTTATEAAILGTPSIYVSSLVGTMGNFIELEHKYDLMYSYMESDKALSKAIELLQKPGLKEEWVHKRKKLLKEKIDVSKFMVWFLENYPESMKIMKNNPNYQLLFSGDHVD